MKYTETERKFLVEGDFKSSVNGSYHIVQGYLCRDPERTVRIRIRDNQGFITVKGLGSDVGMTRFEWEKEISRDEAEALLHLCLPGVIDKTRYLADFGGHTFEIDEFHGAQQGLVLAEIELNAADESFEKPSWLGREVTGDPQYYNSNMG